MGFELQIRGRRKVIARVWSHRLNVHLERHEAVERLRVAFRSVKVDRERGGRHVTVEFVDRIDLARRGQDLVRQVDDLVGAEHAVHPIVRARRLDLECPLVVRLDGLVAGRKVRYVGPLAGTVGDGATASSRLHHPDQLLYLLVARVEEMQRAVALERVVHAFLHPGQVAECAQRDAVLRIQLQHSPKGALGCVHIAQVSKDTSVHDMRARILRVPPQPLLDRRARAVELARPPVRFREMREDASTRIGRVERLQLRDFAAMGLGHHFCSTGDAAGKVIRRGGKDRDPAVRVSTRAPPEWEPEPGTRVETTTLRR